MEVEPAWKRYADLIEKERTDNEQIEYMQLMKYIFQTNAVKLFYEWFNSREERWLP